MGPKIWGAAIASLLLAGCATSASIGTDNFNTAWQQCAPQGNRFATCMQLSAYNPSFTPAEHELIAYYGLVMGQVSRGEISQDQATYELTVYMNRAKANSNYAEAQQAAAIGRVIGASAALAEDIADRRCRAAGTC